MRRLVNVPLRLASHSRAAATPVPSATAVAVRGLFIALLYTVLTPLLATSPVFLRLLPARSDHLLS